MVRAHASMHAEMLGGLVHNWSRNNLLNISQ
jgi:hypothetical protein